MIPAWLHDLSIAYLALGFACAAVIAADVIRHPQHMWIMDVVWPICAVRDSRIVWQYFRLWEARHAGEGTFSDGTGQDPPNRPFAH